MMCPTTISYLLTPLHLHIPFLETHRNQHKNIHMMFLFFSRHSLPLLLSVAFMLADVHFRVELEVRFEARFRQNENEQPADRQRKLILITFKHLI